LIIMCACGVAYETSTVASSYSRLMGGGGGGGVGGSLGASP
jgi:hypothetical protein